MEGTGKRSEKGIDIAVAHETSMSVAARLLIGLITLYRLVLSPLLGPSCRFQPTCSAYAHEAVRRYGGRRGSLMAIRRIMRCHPWGGYGYDPVPDKDAHATDHICQHDSF